MFQTLQVRQLSFISLWYSWLMVNLFTYICLHQDNHHALKKVNNKKINQFKSLRYRWRVVTFRTCVQPKCVESWVVSTCSYPQVSVNRWLFMASHKIDRYLALKIIGSIGCFSFFFQAIGGQLTVWKYNHLIMLNRFIKIFSTYITYYA